MVSVIRSRAEYDELLKETPNACMHFGADWCEPSKQLHNAMNEWDYPKVRLVTAMAEEMEDVAEELGVETVPFIIFYKDGKRISDIAGAKVPEIKAKLETLFETCEKIDTEARIKKLINRDEVMLFMKGDPETPRCGFSRTICGILKEYDVKYGTFDILTDEAIRQGLKKYSDWPTYPQLYVKGDFVGGLDIVKEMHDEGELDATLRGE
eukprot:TRINITY_DN2832_c9_g1_i1.p1 TRINITY_DN2832_c9_g1~~TRINITY_DN2832_c9_g1_i1.p1  ORF type:complete len:209 (+),score=49.07 TRINITY_DN2832_c9_g1_i1:51-677(+)